MLRALLFIVMCVGVGCGGSEPAPTATANAAPVAKVTLPQASATGSGGPPETILFPSEYGNVTFTHQKHFERVNGDCATCHAKIFPQALEPLNYGKARHRVAEEYKTSCAACHGIQGTAFAAERNCQRCHDMGLPKH
jgi:c(7)-type cytochrome triheme protein